MNLRLRHDTPARLAWSTGVLVHFVSVTLMPSLRIGDVKSPTVHYSR